jgi:hypothetical protein
MQPPDRQLTAFFGCFLGIRRKIPHFVLWRSELVVYYARQLQCAADGFWLQLTKDHGGQV